MVAGKKWKITNGDGQQFFVELTKDSTGASVLLVRGEQRTYELAPLSFSLEVIGAATIYDKPSGGNELAHIDGGFFIRITPDRASRSSSPPAARSRRSASPAASPAC